MQKYIIIPYSNYSISGMNFWFVSRFFNNAPTKITKPLTAFLGGWVEGQ